MGNNDSKVKETNFPAALELFVSSTIVSLPENELSPFLFQLVSSLSVLVQEGKLETIIPKLCQQLSENFTQIINTIIQYNY